MKTIKTLLNRSVLLFLFSILASNALAQVDTEFWFVAPEVSQSHNDKNAIIRILAMDKPVEVTITLGGAKIPDKTFGGLTITNGKVTIPAGKTFYYELDYVSGAPGGPITENRPIGTVNNKGLHITTNGPDISVYYDLANNSNPDKFVLKGKAALGAEFYIPSQTDYNNQGMTYPATEKVDVVATKDGTIVEFTTKQTVTDRNGNTYVAGSTNTVKLNTGQTFAIENADLNKSTSLAGMYVRSVDAAGNPDPSKPIAVTISDDSVHDKNVGSGAYDLIGDQIIPLPYLGKTYVAVSTRQAPNDISKIYVTATKPNTIITVYTNVAGISTPISKTITDVGGQVDFELSASAGVGSYIVATEPVYVYQLVSLGGTNQEMGSGILPPLDGCTGSNKVGFVRNLTGDFYVQLTARKKDISSFVVTVGGATDATLTDLVNDITNPGSWKLVSGFSPIKPGTTTPDPDNAWMTKNILMNTLNTTTSNTIEAAGLFHMSILDANGSSISYGYFSGFSNMNLDLIPALCDKNNEVSLKAEGNSLIKTYTWYKDVISSNSGDVLQTDNISPSIYKPTINGTYWVEATAFGGCKIAKSANVVLLPPLTLAGGNKAVCPGVSTLLSATAGFDSYVWTNAIQSSDPLKPYEATFTALANGTTSQQVTVTVKQGLCDKTLVVDIPVNPLPNVNMTVVVPSKVCVGDVIKNTTHNSNYSYDWTINGLKPSPGVYDKEFIVATYPGNYMLVVTDNSNSCVKSAVISNVVVNPLPVINLSDVTACPTTPMTFSGPAASGAGATTYQWRLDDHSLLGSNRNITISKPAKFTLNVVDGNGCKATSPLTTFAWSPEYKLANSGVPQAKCQGVPLRLTIDAGLNNYQWSFKQSGSTGGFINLPGSDAQTNSVLVNPVADPSNNGDYKVVADDTYGCPVSDVVNVTVTATPPLSFPANQTICEGSTLKLLANAGYDSYAWTKDGVPQASNPLTGEVIISSPSQNGLWELTATITSGGCFNKASTNVTVIQTPKMDLGLDRNICPNASIVLGNTLPNDGLSKTYLWSTGENTPTITAVNGGRYWVEVSAAGTTCTSRDEVVLTMLPPPPVVSLPADITMCDINETGFLLQSPLTVPTVASYTWTKVVPSGSDIVLATNSNYTTMSDGEFKLTITDANGCTNSDSQVITSLVGPVPNFMGPDRNMCEGDKLTITVEPGYSQYQWDTDPPGVDDTYRVVGASGGTYKVTVWNNFNFCSRTDVVTITADPLPRFTISSPDVCAGELAVLTPSLSGSLYDFEWWSGGYKYMQEVFQTKNRINAQLNVTNKATGCKYSASANVNWRPIPRVSLGEDEYICPVVGQLEISYVTKGTDVVGYLWGDGTTGESTNAVLTPQVNELYVRSSYGCYGFDQKLVGFLPPPDYKMGDDAPLCNGDSITYDAGPNFFTYEWLKGPNYSSVFSSDQSIVVKEGGSYMVRVNDGCHTLDDTVSVSLLPKPLITSVDTSIYAQVVVFAEDGTKPYKYSMNKYSLQDSKTFSNLPSGDHVFYVEDKNGCTDLKALTLNNNLNIFIPPFITPNGDGYNEKWMIEGLEKLPDSEIIIYNRYGKVLRQYKASDPAWDGKYLGEMLPTDSYWYVVKLVPVDKMMKGYVLIKR